MPGATEVELVCHPRTPTAAVGRVRVDVHRTSPSGATFVFAITGNIPALRIPAPAAPRVVHGLWEHTCCEVFVAAANDSGDDDEPGAGFPYHELNLSPSGEWAGYAFTSRREPLGLADDALAPRVAVRRSDDSLVLEAHIELDRLSPGLARASLRLALSVVLEETSGTLSYWSLRHPADEPDFHHPEAFALGLEAPGNE
jgi:hypothetical protein